MINNLADMVIVNVTEEIKQLIKKINYGDSHLNNCLNSEFLGIEKENEKIIGTGFVGGIFHSYGIEILEEFRGKGIAKRLLAEIINECKQRNFSLISGVFKPTNLVSVKMHMKVGFIPVFNIYYNTQEGREIIVILPLNKKGLFFIKLCKFFDSKFGNLIFAVSFKLMTSFLKNLIAFSGESISPISISQCFKNFKPTKTILEQANEKN